MLTALWLPAANFALLIPAPLTCLAHLLAALRPLLTPATYLPPCPSIPGPSWPRLGQPACTPHRASGGACPRQGTRAAPCTSFLCCPHTWPGWGCGTSPWALSEVSPGTWGSGGEGVPPLSPIPALAVAPGQPVGPTAHPRAQHTFTEWPGPSHLPPQQPGSLGRHLDVHAMTRVPQRGGVGSDG